MNIKDEKIRATINLYRGKAWKESDFDRLCQDVYRMPNLYFDQEYGMCILKYPGTSQKWLVLSETKLKPIRHSDFQRIHDDFVNYYNTKEKSEKEYYDWLKALNLDETKPYSRTTEIKR